MKLPPMEVGYYVPTKSFRRIVEHVGVMRSRDQGLVAIVGPSGDPESHAHAALFSQAGEMFQALELAEEVLASPSSPAKRERALEAIRSVLENVRNTDRHWPDDNAPRAERKP